MAGKKSNQADIYRPRMEAAATAAEKISPFEKEVNDYNMKLWNMYTGKDTFDLSKMPNSNALLTMYDGAKKQSDRGRIGRGLAYGGGPGQEGYNANLIAAMDQQNQDERERDAAGALEQRVADTFAGIGGRIAAAGESDQNRRNNNFSRWAQMYGMEVNKPKKPAWWESLINGGVNAAMSFI